MNVCHARVSLSSTTYRENILMASWAALLPRRKDREYFLHRRYNVFLKQGEHWTIWGRTVYRRAGTLDGVVNTSESLF